MKSKILSIDDELLIHFLNKKLLKGKYPEEDSYFFNSASLALDYLKKEGKTDHLYLILLDINMPEINGWEFMDLLKEKFSHLNFQIHLLTSSIDDRDQRKARDYEYVHSYIFKPLDKSKLSRILDSLPENAQLIF